MLLIVVHTCRPSPVGGPRALQGPAELREKLENIWGSPVPEHGGPPGFGGRAPMFGHPVANGQLLGHAAQEVRPSSIAAMSISIITCRPYCCLDTCSRQLDYLLQSSLVVRSDSVLLLVCRGKGQL